MSAPPPPYSAAGPPAGAYQPQQGYGTTAGGYGTPAGAYQPQPGYAPPYDPSKGMAPPQGPPAGAVPSYQNYSVTVSQPTSQVVVVGGCPACRVGILEDDFTCLGVLCAILFFPLGILCCLAMRQRRCANCGAIYG
ncbi:brain protein I3-like isoform X2 [Haliotis rufescens]|uniref:brain protein I3-like isoform X2 n=1 Tax=Haliotis rufescens TaxID=6454 RepID=UPI001EAFA4F1|nr:brain protein I3-like isoform X2 [Haliotis rufescens]